MKNSVLVYLFLLFTIGVVAQPIQSSSYESMISTAVEAAEGGDYLTAIEWFGKAFEESKDNNLQVAIGDMYVLLRDYPKAEKIYERIIKRDKRDEFFDLRLDWAKTMKVQGKYKEALTELNTFASTTENDSLQKEAKREIKGILDMEHYPENIEAAISFAGDNINSPSAESSPAFYKDGSMYFASMNSKQPVVLDGKEGEYQAKLYVSSRDNQGEFGKSSPLDEAINRVDFYNTGVSFSEDGQRMYFTREKYHNNKVESSQIYLSKRNGDQWSTPYPIDAVNAGNRSRHPYEGELFGGKVLFFVSDIPGGYGGFDIYYSSIKGDEFGLPVNLGPTVNTHKTENSPFYKDGTLYFSSDGHPGMGGMDIFHSKWDGTKWSVPVNMGFNYNTSYDDIFFRLNQSGTSGALVSNRINKDKKKFKNTLTCCDDIYIVQIRDVVIDLKVLVQNNKGNLDGATVELYEGNSKVPTESKTNSLTNDFNFLLDSDKSYMAIITRQGHHPDTLRFNTNGIFDDYTFSKTVIMKEKPVTKRIIKRNEPIVLKSIYFDFNDDKILPDAEKDLNTLKKLMDQYPDLVIELSSHTDSRGDNDFNMKLSQRRADSTKKWLINEGIAANRIKAKGYGETRLLNKCKDGVKCTEEEHQLNRRSEFRIIAGPQTIEITVEE
jgi:peptidoglycan-associated lipoprotein